MYRITYLRGDAEVCAAAQGFFREALQHVQPPARRREAPLRAARVDGVLRRRYRCAASFCDRRQSVRSPYRHTI